MASTSVRAETEKTSASVGSKDVESNKITGSVNQMVNPFSKRAKLLDRPPHFPVANFGRGEVEKSTPPVQPKNVASNNTTQSSGGQINPFSKKDRALNRPTPDFPAVANFGRAEVEKSIPPVQPKNVKTTKTTELYGGQINPFFKKAGALDRPTPDFPVANFGRGEVEKSTPSVQPKNVVSNNTTQASGGQINPFSKKAGALDRPTPDFPVANFGRAEAHKSTPPVQPENVASNKTTQCSGGQINPFSKKARALDRTTPDFPVANFRRAEAEKRTPPVQLKDVVSSKTTDSSSNKVNPFSKRARGVTRPSHFPVPNFVEAQAVNSCPPILSKDVAFKNTDSSSEVNPFSKKAKGMGGQT